MSQEVEPSQFNASHWDLSQSQVIITQRESNCETSSNRPFENEDYDAITRAINNAPSEEWSSLDNEDQEATDHPPHADLNCFDDLGEVSV